MKTGKKRKDRRKENKIMKNWGLRIVDDLIKSNDLICKQNSLIYGAWTLPSKVTQRKIARGYIERRKVKIMAQTMPQSERMSWISTIARHLNKAVSWAFNFFR